MAKNVKFVTICNRSRQTIPLQVKPPGGDFYMQERQVRIPAGKSVQLPADYLMDAQVENLQAKQELQIIK